MADDDAYSRLKAKYDVLQRRVVRFAAFERKLIDARGRLERELSRLGAICGHSKRLIAIEGIEEFTEAVSEAVVDVFEVDIGVLWLLDSSGSLSPQPTATGASTATSLDWPALAAWLEAQGIGPATDALPRVVIRDGLLETALPGVFRLVVCPLLNLSNELSGVVLGVVTSHDRSANEVPIAECEGSFDLFAQLVGTLLDNRADREKVRNRLEVLQLSEAELVSARDSADAASQAKSAFLTKMSREIRTPINGILGMTELLIGNELLENSQRRLAEIAHRSAESLLGVINDILDFSKIETGRIELSEEDFDLRNLLEECLDLVSGQAYGKGLELIEDFPTDLHCMVRGDPARLRQVLINVLGNAVRFTEQGEVRFATKVLSDDGPVLNLQFEIADTGPGIDPDQQAYIFDTFEQAAATSTRRHDGAGLGLAISNQLVSLMDGEIDFTSSPQDGTCFCIRLPLAQALDAGPEEGDGKVFEGIRALIIHDRSADREALDRQLVAWGMESSRAGGDNAALEMLRAASSTDQPFQVALIDRRLPCMTGLALARAIQSDSLVPPLPLVVLASTDFDRLSAAVRDGVISRYLSKPVHQKDLRRCLHDLLTTKSSGDTLPARDPAGGAERFEARILLVEDNPINQEVARGMLEVLGCRVDVVEDGREAVDLAGGTYGLVLMDCHLPGMDGFEAAREIRRREREQGRDPIPIVALTADVQKGTEDRCRAAGMNGYVSKPFKLEQLQLVLERWLSSSHSRNGAAIVPDAGLLVPNGVLEEAPLDQLRRLGSEQGRDVLSKVVGLYLEQAPKLVAAACEGLEREDYSAIREAAHSLKSSSANLGAMAFSAQCAALERAAVEGLRSEMPSLVGDMQQALPIVVAALGALSPVPSSIPVARDPGVGTKERILLVDDDKVFRWLTAEVLRGEGYRVEEAADGREALAQLERKPLPDLVLLDAVMNGMDGFEACGRMRENRATRDLPIVMVTGLEDVDSVNRAFEVGATGFTAKPVNYPILIKRLQFVLRASRTESELREKRAWLTAAQRVARIGYWRWETETGALEISDQLARMCGIDPARFDGDMEDYLRHIHPDDAKRVRAHIQDAARRNQADSINYRLQSDDGSSIVVCQELELKDGGTVLATVQDISRQQAAEDQIRKLAYFDGLTGLASRSYFLKHLDDMIKGARRRGEQFALLFLDLDNFKDVNDSLGHVVGDRLLVVVAQRLKSVLRDCDFVARLGGDEFCLLVDAVANQFDAAEVAERSLAAIAEVVELESRQLRPEGSVGIALYPRDGTSAQDLLKSADTAMYDAKHGGKHCYAFYTEEMTEQARLRLGLEQRLRTAVEAEEFELYYQPVIDMASRRLARVEALVRWRHPERGLVLPGEFIGVIEHIGLIPRLGDWVIGAACKQLVEWQGAGLPAFRVGVNVSPLQCRDDRVVDTIGRVLDETGLDPGLLEIEITESALQVTGEDTSLFDRIKALGVTIALDDFGTGYSSLSSLHQLPIDTLKVDREFLCNVPNSQRNSLLLSTIVGLAHALGHSVVAEGVESNDQVLALSDIGCDLAQGFHFGRPVPADQIPPLVTHQF